MKVGGYFMKVGESSESKYRLYFPLLCEKGAYFGLVCSTFLNFVFSRFRLALGYRDFNADFPPPTPIYLLCSFSNGDPLKKVGKLSKLALQPL